MTRARLAAALLLLAVAFSPAAASTPRPAQPIPASAFAPVTTGWSLGGEPDHAERTRAPSGTGTLPELVDSTSPAPGSVSEAKAWALHQLGSRQYACLSAIVWHESGWRLHAVNPRTGAAGWFQANPASKLDRYGTDPMGQMRFGIAYANARYGSFCGGLAHIREFGWW